MSKLSEKLLFKIGIENIKHQSKWSKALKRGGVSKTNEFQRIFDLPRRDWEKNFDIEELVFLMTQWLKTKKGTMELWPEQAIALHDIYEHQGLFAPIAVGRGKALISLLAPVVLKSKRPVLLVPAQLREQTRAYVIPDMRKHWRISTKLKVVGYSEIQTIKHKDLLEESNPDLLILDEAHYVKNKNAARTKRVRRFIDEKQIPVVVLSGTMTRKSILDYWRLTQWTLKENTPLPNQWREVTHWANALDSDINEDQRVPPGALIQFCRGTETAREGYQRRLTETPGVVSAGEKDLGCSLIIRPIKLSIPDVVQEVLRKLRADWETPNGDFITEAIDLWRHGREIALGFWYRWDPPAPRDWLQARKAWNKFVRDTLSRNRRGLDSPLQVWNECKRLNVDSNHPWHQWGRIKHIFKPNSVAEWISDYAVDAAIKWLDNNHGICWSEHTAFSLEIGKRSKHPIFLGGEKASKEILECQTSCVASSNAHIEGKNLQYQYSKNLIVSPPSSGKTWEQILGRTHREGQEAEEVIADTFMFTEEHQASFAQALRDAEYIQETLEKQKILYANVVKGD